MMSPFHRSFQLGLRAYLMELELYKHYDKSYSLKNNYADQITTIKKQDGNFVM